MAEPALQQVKKRILAVDDEEEILRLYDTFLRYRGYDVVTMGSASECLAYLALNVADVLLLDVNMPGVNGLRLLEMIRSDHRLDEMRIIMISARRDESTVREAVKLGIDSFVVKPFKLRELAERIAMELFTLTDGDLRVILKASLHIRTSLLKEPGLGDFDPVYWDPYPTTFNEQSLAIFLPRGVRPARFVKALADEMEKRVVVFYRHPQKWKKIWPQRPR